MSQSDDSGHDRRLSKDGYEVLWAEVRALRREVELWERLDSETRRTALTAMEKRLELLNEFRGQLREQAATFVTRDFADAEHDRMRIQIQALQQMVADAITEREYDQRHGEVMRRVSELERWRANVSGRYVGLSAIGALFIAVTTGFVVHLVT